MSLSNRCAVAHSFPILAADVVDYFRLMGRDESCTPARPRGIATQPAPSVARYGGRVVNLGDGALVEFASAANALSAATECPLNRRLPSSSPRILTANLIS